MDGKGRALLEGLAPFPLALPTLLLYPTALLTLLLSLNALLLLSFPAALPTCYFERVRPFWKGMPNFA